MYSRARKNCFLHRGFQEKGRRFSITSYKGEAAPRDRLEVGEQVPDFVLEDLAGHEVSFSSYSGSAPPPSARS